MSRRPTRRRLLRSGAAIGTLGLAGCERSDPASTTTPRSGSPPSSATDDVVFDGGGREAFEAALEVLVETPGSTLVVEPGTYRFDPPAGPKPGPHFQVQNLQDATIEGNGARLLMTDPARAAFRFLGGAGVTVGDLTIDYDPVPFTQGTITELSAGAETITLELDEGYPSLSHPMFDAAAGVTGTIHTADGQLIRGLPQRGGLHVRFASMTRRNGRRVDLRRSNPINVQGLAVGRRMAVKARRTAGVSFLNVARPTMENVTVRTAPGMAIKTVLCDRPVVRGATVAPPPDRDRLIGAVADGIHVYDAREGPIIEECHLEQVCDDGIVVDSILLRVTGLRDDRTIAVAGESLKTVRPGDTHEVMGPDGIRRDDLPAVSDVTYRESYDNPWVPAHPETLTFEEPIDDIVRPGDFLANRATTNPGFVVRNNVVRDSTANSVRLSAGPGLVEGNRLVGCSLHGIWMRCDTSGVFSPKRWTNDVVIRDNRISRSGLTYFAATHTAGVHAVYWAAAGVDASGRPHRNVVLTDNEVVETAGTSVLVEDAEDVRLESNRMASPNVVYDGEYGVGVRNVVGFEVLGNTVSGSKEQLSYFGRRERSEEVSSRDNVASIDGTSRSGELVRWVPVTLSFDRTVVPEDGDLHLGFRCLAVTLRDANGGVVRQVDVGGAEDGVEFGRGVYDATVGADERWRWFGGQDTIAELHFAGSELSRATRLELRGEAVEAGISAVVTVDGRRAGELAFETTGVRTYSVDIPNGGA